MDNIFQCQWKRFHLPSLLHDRAQQRCRVKQRKTSPLWNIVSLLPKQLSNHFQFSPPMFLNPSVNLLSLPSGISFSHVSAEGVFQATHKARLLEKVSPCFSLTPFVSFSLVWGIMMLLDFFRNLSSSYCLRELKRRHKTVTSQILSGSNNIPMVKQVNEFPNSGPIILYLTQVFWLWHIKWCHNPRGFRFPVHLSTCPTTKVSSGRKYTADTTPSSA